MDDLRLVRWKETLWYNGLRSVIAGFIWATILLLQDGPPVPAAEAISYYFLMPLLMMPFGLVFKLLTFIPVAGWFFVLILLVWMSVADPFVYLLHKIKPELVPVEHPTFFSIAGFIFVFSPFKEY